MSLKIWPATVADLEDAKGWHLSHLIFQNGTFWRTLPRSCAVAPAWHSLKSLTRTRLLELKLASFLAWATNHPCWTQNLWPWTVGLGIFFWQKCLSHKSWCRVVFLRFMAAKRFSRQAFLKPSTALLNLSFQHSISIHRKTPLITCFLH